MRKTSFKKFAYEQIYTKTEKSYYKRFINYLYFDVVELK